VDLAFKVFMAGLGIVVVAEGMNLTTIDRALYRQVRDYVADAFQSARIRRESKLATRL
jgi:hypothetical protein